MISKNCRKTSRNRRLIVAAAIVLWAGGWGNILAQTDTELEAERTLRELRINMHAPAEPNVPVPDVYRSPPKISEQVVSGKSEWKLFYFCKYHTSDDLQKIIHEQFATKLFDEKGKSTQMTDYTVSSNPATNQLIVRCPAREDVEAVLETLTQVDVPPIQVKIDCLISDIYADLTFDRETTIEIQNLLGENIAMKPGGLPFGTDVRQIIDEGGEVLPAFPGASMREVGRARMGLNIGYLSTSHAFTALVDLLESRGYLKILMNPTLEVVNGGTAKVQTTQKVAIDKITSQSTISNNFLGTQTLFEDVIDSLQVTAHVYADGYIGLETSILLGSKNTPEGVKQIPIITKKQIDNKQNRIRQGESLIIGGMRKNEKFAVVRGVPILKDIPIIGFLFSSEDTEQRAVETVFILTPTISTNGRPKTDVMKEISRRHEPPSPDGVGEAITDPFGFKAREQAHELALDEAEQVRLEAEAEKAQAHIDVRQAVERADRAEEERDQLKTEAEVKARAAAEAQAEADKAVARAKEAQAEAAKAKAQAEAKPKAAEKTEGEPPKPPQAGAAKEPAPEANPSTAQKPKETPETKVEQAKAG